MEIKLFNSLTNKVEVFKPIKEGEVSLYCCGPTVYNDPHIGNVRPPIVFDTLSRFLKYLGYDVKYVSNFTDVDDKIIAKAIKENTTEKEITDKYIAAYKKVLADLHCEPHYKNPRVTEYMNDIIQYIADLEKVGAAYEKDGDVFFKVSSVPNYGVLSNVKTDDLVVGARIDENSKKESPLDFALWKKTNDGIKWDSPWGKGRPGWHTECCVMINSIFGGQIDIHGGGFDLKFPHHENEIAQEEAHDHRNIANVWMHNGFINLDNQKMSKSLGNVVLAKDLIEKFGGNLIRLLILSTHYRSPVNLTEDTITSSKNELMKIEKTYNMASVKMQLEGLHTKKDVDIAAFLNALADDLNTSNALAELYKTIKDLNMLLRVNPIDKDKLCDTFSSLDAMLNILGIIIDAPKLTDELKNIYIEYLNLKKEKRFEESDKLRDVLIANKII